MVRIAYCIRHHIGKHLYYLGYRLQPPSYRRGLACMSALGLAWAKNNESDLLKVMSGEISIEWKWAEHSSPDPER